jgi:uncharacterized protein (TIGR02300 family)
MKRICPNCGTRYYDFQKEPPACPVCATVYDPEALLKSRRSKALPVDDTPKPRKKAAAAVVEDVLADPAEVGPDLEDEEIEGEAAETETVEDDDALLDDGDDLDDEIEEVEVDDTEEEP